MASPCPGNQAQSSLLQPAEIPQRLHISWLCTKGGCWVLNQRKAKHSREGEENELK